MYLALSVGLKQQNFSVRSLEATDFHNIIKWNDFLRYWPFDSPYKGWWREALMFVFFDLRLNKRLNKQSPVIWDTIALIRTSM